NEVLDVLEVLGVRLDDDALLVLVVLAELNRPRNLRDDGVVLGAPRLEQFGDPRQTASDIAGLGGGDRNARQDVAGLDLGVHVDLQNGIDGKQIARFDAASDAHRFAAARFLDDDRRPQLTPARRRSPVDDHAIGRALHLVGLLLHGYAFDQVGKLGHAVDLG